MAEDLEQTTTAWHAEQAAEHIRSINHLTIGGQLPLTDDLYTTVGNLETTCARMPQTFTQLARILSSLRADGRLRIDTTEREAAFEAIAAETDLAAAGAHLDQAAAALQAAHERISHLIFD